MLVFQNVTKIYDGIPVLDNVSLEFLPGKLYALIGPNGSGKTTMMKAASGLVKPESGTITFQGVPISVKTRNDIAYMPTEPYYYNFMTIREVGKYHKDFFDNFDVEYFKKLISYMELSEKLKVKSLSSGMNAKLKIAVTLARRAKVIMLDEPLNGIDMIARDCIISSIIASASSQGNCFLISSHLFDELEPIVNDVVMVRYGKIIISGDINEIRKANNKSISDLYREIYGGANYNPYAGMPQYPQYPQQGAPQYPQQGMSQYPQYPQAGMSQYPQQGVPQYTQYPQQCMPQYTQYPQNMPYYQPQNVQQPTSQINPAPNGFASLNGNAQSDKTADNSQETKNKDISETFSEFAQISENTVKDGFFDANKNSDSEKGGRR